MKTLKTALIPLALLLATQGVLASAEGEITRISCLVTKSVSLIVELRENVAGPDQVTLTEQLFLHDATPVATLQHPMVVRYGNVLTILQDRGRSGYAFLRFQRTEDGRLEGWIDINLFLSHATSNTGGNLWQLPCTGRI